MTRYIDADALKQKLASSYDSFYSFGNPLHDFIRIIDEQPDAKIVGIGDWVKVDLSFIHDVGMEVAEGLARQNILAGIASAIEPYTRIMGVFEPETHSYKFMGKVFIYTSEEPKQ